MKETAHPLSGGAVSLPDPRRGGAVMADLLRRIPPPDLRKGAPPRPDPHERVHTTMIVALREIGRAFGQRQVT